MGRFPTGAKCFYTAAKQAPQPGIRATGHKRRIRKIGPPLVFPSKAAKLFLTTLDAVLAAPYRFRTVVKSTPHLLEFLTDADPDRVLINGTGGNHGKRHGHAPAGFGAI